MAAALVVTAVEGCSSGGGVGSGGGGGDTGGVVAALVGAVVAVVVVVRVVGAVVVGRCHWGWWLTPLILGVPTNNCIVNMIEILVKS